MWLAWIVGHASQGRARGVPIKIGGMSTRESSNEQGGARTSAEKLWDLSGYDLVCAGEEFTDLTRDDRVAHLGRLEGRDLLMAGHVWPGLRREDLIPHLSRFDEEMLVEAGLAWAQLERADLAVLLQKLSDLWLFKAGHEWPGLAREDLLPHFGRLSIPLRMVAITAWPGFPPPLVAAEEGTRSPQAAAAGKVTGGVTGEVARKAQEPDLPKTRS